MRNVILLVSYVFTLVLLLAIIAAIILSATNNLVVLKVFQGMDYTMTVAGFTVAFLWIASIIFGI